MLVFPTPHVPAASERPDCPMCGASMRLVWIEPDVTHRDRHTLECRSCEQLIEVIVEREGD
jgi:C4-type Zn-finger protein